MRHRIPHGLLGFGIEFHVVPHLQRVGPIGDLLNSKTPPLEIRENRNDIRSTKNDERRLAIPRERPKLSADATRLRRGLDKSP